MLFRELPGFQARLSIHEGYLQASLHVRSSVRRQLDIEYQERHTYVKTNNPQSAYAQHIRYPAFW